MSRGYAIRLSLTAAALASIAIVLLQTLGVWSAGTLPLDAVQQANGLYVVHRDNHFALPSPLRDGDVLALGAMTPAARAITIYGVAVQAGAPVAIAVLRAGHP